MSDYPILVTGAAGFIGFHVAGRLLRDGRRVVGIDSLNDYYNPALKDGRFEILRKAQSRQDHKVLSIPMIRVRIKVAARICERRNRELEYDPEKWKPVFG